METYGQWPTQLWPTSKMSKSPLPKCHLLKYYFSKYFLIPTDLNIRKRETTGNLVQQHSQLYQWAILKFGMNFSQMALELYLITFQLKLPLPLPLAYYKITAKYNWQLIRKGKNDTATRWGGQVLFWILFLL